MDPQTLVIGAGAIAALLASLVPGVRQRFA